MTTTKKHCTKCHSQTNPFGVDRSTTDGLMKQCKVCVNKRNAAYRKTPQGKQANNKAKQKWKESNPKKVDAQKAVADLPWEPCEICDETQNVVKHHDDYDKPTRIRFLCAQHHRDWHCKHGEAKNAI